MNRYEMKTPRTLFGAVAVVMAALTLGFAVVLPAVTGPQGHDALAAAKVAAPPTAVAINPSHLEIVGVREQTVASANRPAQVETIGARQQELANTNASHVALE
jgi:hypothetical protein